MGNKKESDDAASTWEIITTLLGWQREAERALKEGCSTTLTQFWVLIVLNIHGALSAKQVANILELRYTTIAECIVTLEQKGAVVKTRCEDDRRVVTVSITKRGLELFYLWDNCLIDLARRAWGDFDKESRENAFHSFYRMGKKIGKMRWLNDKVRGDTAFLITCSQITSNFQEISETLLVSSPQAILLMLLEEQGTIQPKDVAFLMAKQPSEISKLLTEAKEKGLAELKEGNTKREVLIRLTKNGYEKATAIESESKILLEKLFDKGEGDMDFLMYTSKHLLSKLQSG